jgi:DNA modification methylase
MTNLAIEQMKTSALKPYSRNARTHSKKQIRQIAESIEAFGFNNPVLISDDNEIVAGHGRHAAAKHLGLETVPCVRLSHLTPAQRRAYILADNKLALNAGWDQELLAFELEELKALEIDIELTGFTMPAIDIILEEVRSADPKGKDDIEDALPDVPKRVITKPGDVWVLGRHRLICGDARDPKVYEALLGDEEVGLIFTDPPYNVPIARNVSGRGQVRHGDFAMAAGEMSREEFTQFLEETLRHAAGHCRDGAIAYVCMDWRHMAELQAVGERVFTELKNVCVWNKGLGGQGSFYRSQYELVFVFKVGEGRHINNFGLGAGGRYRTNVWDYAGANGFSSSSRQADLGMHPTVKPVQMIKDALLDCSKRGDIVLDCFAGSGSTLVAAHKCGRTARLVEYDPAYCDVIIQRFEKITGKEAILRART